MDASRETKRFFINSTSPKIQKLLEYCREHQIKTVLYADKEVEMPAETMELFDCVFDISSGSITDIEKLPDTEKAYALPSAVQTRIFTPARHSNKKRKKKSCMVVAGAQDKEQESWFHLFASAALRFGPDIYCTQKNLAHNPARASKVYKIDQ